MPYEEDKIISDETKINPDKTTDEAVKKANEEFSKLSEPKKNKSKAHLSDITTPEQDESKLNRLIDGLGINQINEDLADQRSKIDSIIQAQEQTTLALNQIIAHLNKAPGSDQENPPKNMNEFNAMPQEMKVASLMQFMGPLLDAYKTYKMSNAPQQNNPFDFKEMAAQMVTRMFQTQMDSMAMNAYQAPLTPPTWFQNRTGQNMPPGINPPQPSQQESRGHGFE